MSEYDWLNYLCANMIDWNFFEQIWLAELFMSKYYSIYLLVKLFMANTAMIGWSIYGKYKFDWLNYLWANKTGGLSALLLCITSKYMSLTKRTTNIRIFRIPLQHKKYCNTVSARFNGPTWSVFSFTQNKSWKCGSFTGLKIILNCKNNNLYKILYSAEKNILRCKIYYTLKILHSKKLHCKNTTQWQILHSNKYYTVTNTTL